MKQDLFTTFPIDMTLSIEGSEHSTPSLRFETHRIFQSGQCLVTAQITYFYTLSDFVNHWWDTYLIEAEFNAIQEDLEWFGQQLTLSDFLTTSINTLFQQFEEKDFEEATQLLQFIQIRHQFEALIPFKGLSIENIYANQKGTGLGTCLIQHYQKEVDYIFLYSEMAAEGYWEKQGFTGFYNGYYVWTKQPEIQAIMQVLFFNFKD